MGLELLDIGFLIEKKFGLKRFRPFPSVAPQLWTAGDLFEQVWRGLQGEEPAWDLGLILEILPLQRQAKAYLEALHKGWRFFMPYLLDQLIPADDRPEVWNRLATLYQVDLPPLGPPDSDGHVQFPPRCKATRQLLDLVERAWWDGRNSHQDQWRPSTNPPPADAHKWTRESAWAVFAEILGLCLGVELYEVTPDATMFGDLGL